MIMRNTVQRTLVLETVKKMQCHPTADQVYETIIQEYPDISRATVYRNLNVLCGMDLIRKVAAPDGADRYDHVCHRHYHVKCTQCGKFFDVDMPFIHDLEKKIHNTHDFIFTDHDIIFRGICPECQTG